MKNKILILIFSLSLSSCDEIFFEKDKASTNPKANFEYLWKECNEKYAYMDYKGINWNEVHDRYAAQISDKMLDDSLFAVLGKMMNELRDGHVNLKSFFNISHYNFQQVGPKNFDFRLIEDHYLPKDYLVSGPFIHDFIANKTIGYIRLSSFPGTVDHDNLNYVMARYHNARGIILDLRENGGGALSDVFTLLSHLVTTKTQVYNTRIKSGPGREEFSAMEPGYVSPAGNIYTGRVTVLTDRGTFSAGSFSTLALKELPNVLVLGDTTGGGLGLPNGGQLPNGWTYRFSITQTLDLAGNNYENGVPPDLRVVLNASDVARGKDTVIEQAILQINQ